MFRKFWHVKDFKHYFFIYVTVFFCVIVAGIVIVVATTQAEYERNDLAKCQAQGQKIAEMLDSSWDSAIEAGNLLRNSTWVQKFMSETDVFSEEFDMLGQRDFSQQLTALCASTDLIRDMSILYSQKNTVVTTAGWFSLEEYEVYAAQKFQIPTGFLAEHVQQRKKPFGPLLSSEFAFSNSGYLVYVQQMDISDSPRALTIVFIDKAALQKKLEQLCDKRVIGVHIDNSENQTYLTYGANTAEAGAFEEVFSSKNMLVNYRIFFQPFTTSLSEDIWFILICIGLIMASVFLAYGLARVQFSPLNRLINKINTHAKVQTPCIDSINTITAYVDGLHDENATLEHTLASYRHTLRNQMNLQLLKGYFSEDISEELSFHKIPFSYHDWYIVLLVQPWQEEGMNIQEETRSRIQLLLTLKNTIEYLPLQQIHCEIVENMEGHIAIIAEFASSPDEENVIELGETLYDHLLDRDIDCAIFASRPRKGLIGISLAYQEAKEAIQQQPDKLGVTLASPNVKYYYPLDWESQWIRAMREGNTKLGQAVLWQLYEENAALHLSYTLIQRLATLLYETMRRIILESSLPMEIFLEIEEPQYSKTLEQVFKTAEEATRRICEQVQRQRTEAATAMSQSLVEYIDANVFNPELSLNMLSDVFGVSNASISRISKNTLGENFYNYVTDKRMRKAQEILRFRGYSSKGFAAEVGYDNEYSFKRAFIRKFGISPKDYAEQVTR